MKIRVIMSMRSITIMVYFMSSSLMLVSHSLPLANISNATQEVATSMLGCEPGEDDCTKCYNVLVNDLLINDRNLYNLQRAFFPPDTSNPVFVRVTYYFTRNMSGDGTTNYSLTSPSMEWSWTASTFYLFQPVESLQYTSLLFTDPSLRVGNVSLYLHPSCFVNDTNRSFDSLQRMKLLTQRLKNYAMHLEVKSEISENYDAKGENRETLSLLYNGNNPSVREGVHISNYVISFQVMFPIIVMIFLGWLFYHLIENNKKRFFSKFRVQYAKNWLNGQAEPSVNKTSDENELWEFKISTMYIVMSVLGSLTFILYVIVLDCLAVGYRNSNQHVMSDIFFLRNFSTDFGNDKFYFEVDYSIPHIMLVYDIVILLVTLIVLGFISCCRTKQWYYVFLGPCSCIIVHSYHILIGFIHTPHHATGILVFHAIVIAVFVVTYRATYYNLVHCAQCCCKRDDLTEENKKSWKSRLFKTIILCFIILSFFVSGFLTYTVILFLIVPINLAIDEAPNSLFSIHQTILIFISAAITYKLYQKRTEKTIIDQLVNANTEHLRNKEAQQTATSITSTKLEDWNGKHKGEKQTEMASLLLDALLALKQSGQPR